MSPELTLHNLADLGGALLRSAGFRRRDVDIPLCSIKDFAVTPPLKLDTDNRSLAKLYKRASLSHYASVVSRCDHALFWETMIRMAPYKNYTFEGLDDLVSRCYPGLPVYSTACVEPISVLYQVLFLMTLDPRVTVDKAKGDQVRLVFETPVKTAFIEANAGRFAVEQKPGRGLGTRYQRATILWQGQNIDNWWHLPSQAMAVRLGVRAASAGRFLERADPSLSPVIQACLGLAQQARGVSALFSAVTWSEQTEREHLDLATIRGRLIPLLGGKSHLSLRQRLYTLTVPHMIESERFISVFGDPMDRFVSHLSVKYIEDGFHHLTGFIR